MTTHHLSIIGTVFNTNMNLRLLNLLIKEGEGLTIEFKERFTSRIDQDIVAFANSKGGKILLGVSDNGNISGEKINKSS